MESVYVSPLAPRKLLVIFLSYGRNILIVVSGLLHGSQFYRIDGYDLELRPAFFALHRLALINLVVDIDRVITLRTYHSHVEPPHIRCVAFCSVPGGRFRATPPLLFSCPLRYTSSVR